MVYIDLKEDGQGSFFKDIHEFIDSLPLDAQEAVRELVENEVDKEVAPYINMTGVML
ncbi:gp160 [Bacillus phage W.Ph.]|uniref:Gp160 n=1 Tax=Bacillus phage W.Ph. TaxID=764595 RepID=G9B1R1_9CAUD|nr:gp160 [Bacillus phage W.Ph.]ADH03306.1 gp160 [Bacillus phage W.Ph.]